MKIRLINVKHIIPMIIRNNIFFTLFTKSSVDFFIIYPIITSYKIFLKYVVLFAFFILHRLRSIHFSDFLLFDILCFDSFSKSMNRTAAIFHLFPNDVEQWSPSRHHHHFRKSRMHNFISIQNLQITFMSFPHSSLYWEMRKTMLNDFCSSICRQFMRFYIWKVKFCCFIQKLLLLIEISEYFYWKKLSV